MISLEDASLTKKGIVKLSSATDSDSEALAATPKAVKTVMGEVRTKAPLDSPAFTGTPTTPTPPGDAKGLQTTNAEFVRKLIAALVGSVLEPLDTLQELADALGNDPNFATTVLNKLAGKQPLDETLTALSGKSVDGLIEYVGLRETISRAADDYKNHRMAAIFRTRICLCVVSVPRERLMAQLLSAVMIIRGRRRSLSSGWSLRAHSITLTGCVVAPGLTLITKSSRILAAVISVSLAQ